MRSFQILVATIVVLPATVGLTQESLCNPCVDGPEMFQTPRRDFSSPNATTVITADEMRRLGVISVVDLVDQAVATSAMGQGSISSCDSAQQDVVRLEGRLIELTFPGPPNYESVERGDSPETVSVLLLPQVLCFRDESRDWDVQMIQVIGLDEAYFALIGREIELLGSLFRAESGHHHTPIILEASAIQPLK